MIARRQGLRRGECGVAESAAGGRLVRRGATSRVDLATLSVTVEQDSTMSALVIRCRRMPIQDRWTHDPKGGNTTVEQVMPRQRMPGR